MKGVAVRYVIDLGLRVFLYAFLLHFIILTYQTFSPDQLADVSRGDILFASLSFGVLAVAMNFSWGRIKRWRMQLKYQVTPPMGASLAGRTRPTGENRAPYNEARSRFDFEDDYNERIRHDDHL